MCGCTKGSKNNLVNSSVCQGRVSDLHKIRNGLITLEKLTNDPEKKAEYKEIRTDVEEMLKEAVNTCPDFQAITALKDYIDNEYASYNN